MFRNRAQLCLAVAVVLGLVHTLGQAPASGQTSNRSKTNAKRVPPASRAPSRASPLRVPPGHVLPPGGAAREADGPRSAKSTAPLALDLYSLKPMATQPRCPPIKPIDVASPRACLFELAALASFEVHREGDLFSIANGAGSEGQLLPVDPMNQLERTIRFDQLLAATDPQLRAVATNVRQISEDVTRINRFNHAFGLVAGLANSLMLQRAAGQAMFHISRWVHDENARAQATYVERLPGGREVERFDSARYEELAERESVVTAMLRPLGAQQAAELEERKFLRIRSDRVRGLVQEKMAAIWAESLMPKLLEQAGPAVERPLLDIRSYRSFLGKIDGPPPPYGSVAFRNPTASALHNVTVEIRLKDKAGEQTRWYCHFRELAPKTLWLMAFPTMGRQVIPGSSERIEASYTLLCDEGRTVAGAIALGPEPDPAAWTEATRQRRQTERELLFEQDREARAQEAEFLKLVRAIFPAPRNPVTARTRLVELLQKSTKYQTGFKSENGTVWIALVLEPFAADAKEIKATLTTETEGRELVTPLMGRLVDEADRGCVLGLVPAEGESHRLTMMQEIKDRMDKSPDGNLKKYSAGLQANAGALEKKRLARWSQGGIPLLTSPTEALGLRDLEQLVAGKTPQPLKDRVQAESLRNKQCEFASEVIYVDSAGRLSLQHIPATAAGKRQFFYLPLAAN